MSYQKEKAPAATGAHEIESRKSMSNNIVQQFEGELRVSSDAIAVHTENEHRAVLQLIGTYMEELEVFGQVAFEMRAGYNNASVRVAQLNEQQATLLITFMRNSAPVRDFKLRLVREFYVMRQAITPALPQGQELLALAVVEAQAMLAAKDERIAELAPKADYVDTFVADGDLRLLRNVAKSVGVAERQLRNDLLERKWIYAEKTTRWSEREQAVVPVTRYSAYSHKGDYFSPVPNHEAPRFKGELMHTLKITPQGALAIARMYGVKEMEIV